MGRTYMAGILLTLGLLLWFVPPALAEPYAGLYGGISLLSDAKWKTNVVLSDSPEIDDDGFVFVKRRRARLGTDIDDSAMFGGKIGYWFDFFPFIGAELDIYGFKPDIRVHSKKLPGSSLVGDLVVEETKFDVLVVSIGLNIMGRYPFLKGPNFPRGRIQPYIGIGPALFITSIDDQTENEDDNLGETTLTFGGLQALLGGKFFILKKLAVFAEYKYTYFTSDLGGVSENRSLNGTLDINAHHLYAGIAYHFY